MSRPPYYTALAWAILWVATDSLPAHAATPRAHAEGFYRVYLKYIHGLAGKSRTPDAAAREDRAATAPFLSKRYAERLDARRARCAAASEPTADCDGDPFYCAQEPPASFHVVRTSKTTQSAWVRMELRFGAGAKRVAVVRLDQAGGRWVIDRVRCVP
jgi:hypothetical protein